MFTFSVKESSDAQFIFGDVEGVVEVSEVVVGVEVSVVDEIGAVRVNESVETQPIAPARREVGDISRDMRVAEIEAEAHINHHTLVLYMANQNELFQMQWWYELSIIF